VNPLKRAFLHIKRTPVRFFILFTVVLVLAALMAGALSIRQAVSNADLALRARVPAVATIEIDNDAFERHIELTGEWPEALLTSSIVHEIASLPYVRSFDYSAWGAFYSYDLQRAFDKDAFVDAGLDPEVAIDIGALSYFYDTHLEQFWLRGTQSPGLIDISAGLIELTVGRTFVQEEIDNLSNVAIVSRDFLDTNNLSIGSYFELDFNIYRQVEGGLVPLDFYSPENLLHSQTVELEIIGVFEKKLPDDKLNLQSHFDILNRIYVPNIFIESFSEVTKEVFLREYPDIFAELDDVHDEGDIIDPGSMLFLLYDPVDLSAFSTAATALLPSDIYMIEDRTDAYEFITSSMEMMREIINGLLVGVIIASLTILSLLILLFVIDRRQEIGIYLALGERKRDVFSQVLTEMVVACAIAVTLALFVGNILGGEISHTMIEQDLIAQIEDPDMTFSRGQLYGLGFQTEMTPEEMLSAYEVRLDITTVALFYGVMMAVVSLSTLISVLYMTRLNPKKILM